MGVAALVISVLSAAAALATLLLTRAWRREAHRTAIVALCMSVRRRQVYEDPDIASWSASGVHTSVYEIREDLFRAIPTLPWPALPMGERMIDACLRYLIALRRYSHGEEDDEMSDDALRQHRAWVDELGREIDALRALAGRV